MKYTKKPLTIEEQIVLLEQSMMEKEANNKEWGLIRNENGEWISDEYAVFLSQIDAICLKSRALHQGKELHIQHGTEGQLWCYRHELDAIDLTEPEPVKREINVKKPMAGVTDVHYHCENEYKGDNPFKKAARSKQSWFRENYLKVGFDPSNKYGKYGAFLMPEDAAAGLNFYEGFRSEILCQIEKNTTSIPQSNMMDYMQICSEASIFLGMYLFL